MRTPEPLSKGSLPPQKDAATFGGSSAFVLVNSGPKAGYISQLSLGTAHSPGFTGSESTGGRPCTYPYQVRRELERVDASLN